MSQLIVPYNSAMKLGSGFNSYTQTLCIDRAVVRDEIEIKQTSDTGVLVTAPKAEIAQCVTFKTELIDKISDLTDSLNVNGILTVKASNIASANGTGSFINSDIVHENDINFLISCKVVNQTQTDESLTKFQLLPNLKQKDFTDIYGDCFISGFQIGGEFNALISIKVRDQTQKTQIAAKATLAFTTPGSAGNSAPPPAGGAPPASGTAAPGAASGGGGGLNITADAQVAKDREDVMHDNEVTISVSYNGGGQHLKDLNADWNFSTLREAATKFPELVAATPVKINAVLTKYTALKSFYAAESEARLFEPLSYENAGAYTTVLQDSYLSYKKIHTELQLLGQNVSDGKMALTVAPDQPELSEPVEAPEPPKSIEATPEAEAGSDATSADSTREVIATPASSTTSSQILKTLLPQPYIVRKPYSATLFGLEKAKRDVRILMGRIVQEVDAVSKDPRVAMMFDREPSFMPPLIFRLLLPKGTPVSGDAPK